MCSGVRHIRISDQYCLHAAYRKLSIHGFPRAHFTITYRNFRKFNLECFRNDIASHVWDHIHNLSNPNDMWSEWKKSFLEIVDKHTPLRKARVRWRSSPWITSELKKQMHKGRFTRYDFVACDNGLRQAHDMIYDCCVRQEKCRSILKHVSKRCDNRKSCRRPVVSLSHATKSYRVNRP